MLQTISDKEGNGPKITHMRQESIQDDGDDPIAKAMAMGARIPRKGNEDSDDY